MSILTVIWNNWSTYEKIREAGLLSLTFILILLAIYYTTKDKKITLLSVISIVSAAILNTLGLFISNLVFHIDITEIFRLTPLITSILLISNLGLLAGFYAHKKHNKDFSFTDLRAEYRSDSIKQTLFLILLSFAMFLFVSPQTQAILAISVFSTLISVWGMYWISKHILK